jgi:hypothetical protein
MTPQTHPHLVSAFQSGYEYRPYEQYELGLSSMLDGFEPGTAPPNGREPDRLGS